MFQKILLLFLVCLVPSASAAPVVNVHRVPITVRDGQVFIHAVVSGKEETLLVDTGAAEPMFKKSLMPKHGSIGRAKVDGVNGTADYELAFADISITDVDGESLSFHTESAFGDVWFPPSSQGILGMSVLSKFSSVQFDFHNRQMILTDQE